jgi:glutamine amidotransferase
MGYIAVIDYGAGNLMSVTNALNFLGYENKITADIGEIERADRVILPGVGAFPAAMDNLTEKGFVPVLKEQAKKKPLLGICLGMQMLFDRSFEISECAGLGLIPGIVRKIRTDLKLPHIGWNSLEFKNPCPLLDGIEPGAYVYFVHSFCAETARPSDLIASADYGEHVAGLVACGNAYGCQFHPEKSGDVGLKILKNFCAL